jgi:hypothetical protein
MCAYDGLQVQDLGAVWRRDGADNRLDKVGALIPLEDGFAEVGGGNKSVCGGVR